jgi:hypothetical protein
MIHKKKKEKKKERSFLCAPDHSIEHRLKIAMVYEWQQRQILNNKSHLVLLTWHL